MSSPEHHHHHHHHHHVGAGADRRSLAVALALIAGFMVVEVVAGVLAGSLALLSDAAHMLTDAGALGLALVAARLAARPAGGNFTFGLGRAEILSAQVNGAVLLVLAAVIGVEAIGRLSSPPDVEGTVVIVVGVVGAIVNVAAAMVLSGPGRRSLNVEGARAHVLTDLYASLGAAAAGVVIVTTDFREADGIAALLVAALVLRSGWSLVRDAGRVLLEASPRGMPVEDIGRAMAAAPGVVEVHDLHVWEVTSDFAALSAHVLVRDHDDCHRLRGTLETLLHDRFGIDHTTLQVDHVTAPELLQIEGSERGGANG